jgi:hypothetical protein
MQVGIVALKLYGIEFANLGDNVRKRGEEENERKKERGTLRRKREREKA